MSRRITKKTSQVITSFYVVIGILGLAILVLVTALIVAVITPTASAPIKVDNATTRQTDGYHIELKPDSGIVHITAPGSYDISGSVNDGGLVINVDSGTVTIALNGVKIVNNYGPAISIEKASGFVNIIVSDHTENYLTNGLFDSDRNAVIYSKVGLGISGYGTLNINARTGEGIISEGQFENKNATIIISGVLQKTTVGLEVETETTKPVVLSEMSTPQYQE